MTRVALVLLCLALGSCATTEAERQDIALNGALVLAYNACRVALDNPLTEWEPGAKSYCKRIVNEAPECPDVRP